MKIITMMLITLSLSLTAWAHNHDKKDKKTGHDVEHNHVEDKAHHAHEDGHHTPHDHKAHHPDQDDTKKADPKKKM